MPAFEGYISGTYSNSAINGEFIKESLDRIVPFYAVFGDSTRLGIIWALSESEMCVCDICALLKMNQPAVSHQLKNLKLARIVKARREGKIVYYSLEDEHIRDLLNLAMEHVQET